MNTKKLGFLSLKHYLSYLTSFLLHDERLLYELDILVVNEKLVAADLTLDI